MARNVRIDSAKGLLIFLVVFAHAVIPIRTEPILFVLYKLIYSVHMPAFIFIAGMMAHKTVDQTSAAKLVERIIVPLLVFEFIHELLDLALTGSFKLKLAELTPHWTLWFLLSLFIWRLLTPVIYSLRWPVITCIVVACVALMAPQTGTYLSVARTFSFLPFFAIGVIYGELIITKIQNLKPAVAVSAAAIALLVISFITDNLKREIFFGSDSFASLGLDIATGLELRLIAYAVSFLAILAILALALQTTFMAKWGRYSLIIYLWHSVIFRISRNFYNKEFISDNAILMLVAFTLASILICWLFSRPTVVKITNGLLKPLQNGAARITK